MDGLRLTSRLQNLLLLTSTLALVAILAPQPSRAQLSTDFYAASCPNVAGIVRDVFRAELARSPTAAAAMLRLFFHDCIVQGCDASVLLDSQGGIVSELESGLNFGIRLLNIIDNIKTALELVCPNTVSCADIVTLTGREAVSASGGPFIPVQLGRRDSLTASKAAADAQIPPPDISFNGFVGVFAQTGMTLEESVAILGGHTLGVGHCRNVVNRLYPTREADLNLFFYNVLKLKCPPQFSDQTTLINDVTSLIFDNVYFIDTRTGLGLFTVDAEVATNPSSAPIVNAFSQNKQAFFQAFNTAFQKLSLFNLLTGSQGEVRQNCHRLN